MRWWIAILLMMLMPVNASAQLHTKIKHWVVIVLENRSMDSMFATFTGVKDSPVTTSKNGLVTLVHQSPLVAEGEMFHGRADGTTDIASGAMSGFQTNVNCGTSFAVCPYSFLNGTDLPYVWKLATTYGLCDYCFPSVLGPSYPNHFLLITGTSNLVDTNPSNQYGMASIWTCFSQVVGGGSCAATGCSYDNVGDTGTFLTATDPATGTQFSPGTCGGQCPDATYCHAAADCTTHGGGNCISGSATNISLSNSTTACTTSPDTCGGTNGTGFCQLMRAQGQSAASICPSSPQVTKGGSTVSDLFQELTGASVTHKWYSPGFGHNFGELWIAPWYTTQGAFGTEASNVFGMSQWFTDVANSTLPSVAYITPAISNSFHPTNNNDYRQTAHNSELWLASVLTPLLSSPSYASTQVFIWWDDWGGYNDHVVPPTDAAYSNMGPIGIRTPLIAVGPYSNNAVFHGFGTAYSTAVQVQDSLLACFTAEWSLTSLGHRADVANSLCATNGSGMTNESNSAIASPFPANLTSKPTSTFAKADSPDVIDAMHWIVNRMPWRNRPHRDDDDKAPTLETRKCVVEGTTLRTMPWHRGGGTVDVCMNEEGSIILPPGDNGEDHDEPDGPPKKHHKWLHRIAKVSSSALMAKLADDATDGVIGPNKARYVGLGAFTLSMAVQNKW